MVKAAKRTKAAGVPSVETPGGKAPQKLRYQIESPTRGVYVGNTYAQRTTNWPMFTHSPWSEDAIIRFDDRAAAAAELVYVRGYAANARLRGGSDA